MKDTISILILEDNRNDLELLLWELNRSGLQYCYRASNDRAGFEQAMDEFIPDIVLADFALPSFDGYSAFKIVRDREPDVPFIIVSGSVGEEKAVELIKSGVTDYALKDRLFTLPSKIQRALHDYRSCNEKKEADEQIRLQNKKLAEIAHFQSHIVRTPICQMKGLFNLMDFEDFSNPDNKELIGHLKEVAATIDDIVHRIVKMTNEVERMTTRDHQEP